MGIESKNPVTRCAVPYASTGEVFSACNVGFAAIIQAVVYRPHHTYHVIGSLGP